MGQMPKTSLNSADAKALQEFLVKKKANDKQQQHVIKAVNKLGTLPAMKDLEKLLKEA
jgi:hypothetical protein